MPAQTPPAPDTSTAETAPAPAEAPRRGLLVPLGAAAIVAVAAVGAALLFTGLLTQGAKEGAVPPDEPGNGAAADPGESDTGSAPATSRAEEAAGGQAKEPEGLPLELDTIMVNVYKTRQRRYLVVKVTLMVKDRETLASIEKQKLEVRDQLISLLKAKTLEELDEPEVTQRLGREIQDALDLSLGLKRGIVGVFFSQFVVQ